MSNTIIKPMPKLYIVKGGFNPEGKIETVDYNPYTTYHAISLHLNTIDGCIEKKVPTNWRLCIQNGETRKYHFPTFKKCIDKLKELFHPADFEIINGNDITRIKDSKKRNG